MKDFLLRIKNLIPYLLLVAIYFFLVNLEVKNGSKRNELEKNRFDSVNVNNDESTDFVDSPIRIKIPIIPYSE